MIDFKYEFTVLIQPDDFSDLIKSLENIIGHHLDTWRLEILNCETETVYMEKFEIFLTFFNEIRRLPLIQSRRPLRWGILTNSKENALLFKLSWNT